jgi:hypothetical protein
MLARTIELGRRPTPDEVLANVRADLAGRSPLEVDIDTLRADLADGRP